MVPVTNRPRYALECSVRALNGHLRWEQVFGPESALVQERRFEETPPLLRKLVQAWQESGPDPTKFSFYQQRKMWEAEAWQGPDPTNFYQGKMWADVVAYWKTVRTQLVRAPGGGAGVFMNNGPDPDPYKEALRLFIELLLNPDCDKLAGPCPRCGNYYICRSARNKVYCSRSCGTRTTALAATRKRRDEEHADKLLRAAEGAREWTTARTKKEWKPWVSGRHPDITAKFLTRAVNNGELKPPTKGRKP